MIYMSADGSTLTLLRVEPGFAPRPIFSSYLLNFVLFPIFLHKFGIIGHIVEFTDFGVHKAIPPIENAFATYQ